MNKLIPVCAALWVAQMTPLYAADSEGRFAAGYPATLTCEAFSQMEPTSREIAAVAGFAEGWLAAHARLTPDVFDLTPWQSIEYVIAQIRSFCAARPSDRIMTAMIELTKFFEPDALKEGGTPVSITNGDQVILVHPETLERIVGILSESGFIPADPDKVVIGLEAFQRSNDLPVNGLPDQRTLQRLFSKR